MKLTQKEIEWLENHPAAIEAAMDYHDIQVSQGEAMGFDCSAHQQRFDELKAEHEKLKAAWEIA